MFTGLIMAVGRVAGFAPAQGGARLQIDCPALAGDLGLGESVAVNGLCLTVASREATAFVADLSPETLARTAPERLAAGRQVNLERALGVGDRLGGHIVNGHVDGLGRVLGVRVEGGFQRWRFSLPTDLSRYVVEKGSIAVDGASLTVACRDGDAFEVALIPETLARTAFPALRQGDPVNLEVDILAKYVEGLMGGTASGEASLERALRDHGYMM